MGRRKLHSGNDEDERGSKSNTSKTPKDDSIDGLTWLDRRNSHDSACEDQKSGEQGRSDCPEPCAPVAPENCCAQAGDPKWLFTSHQQERIRFEEISGSASVSEVIERGENNSQDRVEDNVRKQYDSLNKYEGNANGKSTASSFSTFEKFVVKNASLGTFPFVNGESNQDEEPNGNQSYGSSIRPWKQATSQVESGKEYGKACGKETESDEVEVGQLLPE